MPKEQSKMTLLNQLNVVDINDDDQFNYLLKTSLLILNMRIEDFGRNFDVSKITVKNWIDKITSPHPLMRKHVYNFLANEIQNKLKNSTCCKNIANTGPVELCSKPTTHHYLHYGDICSYCDEHNYKCGLEI